MKKAMNQYREMVLANYKVGDQVNPSLTVSKIGYKYVTCRSIMDTVHDVKYTFIEFVFNFMNK